MARDIDPNDKVCPFIGKPCRLTGCVAFRAATPKEQHDFYLGDAGLCQAMGNTTVARWVNRVEPSSVADEPDIDRSRWERI